VRCSVAHAAVIDAAYRLIDTCRERWKGVALSIKNEETEQLSRQLANVTGETLTEAIRASVEERYERLRRVNS